MSNYKSEKGYHDGYHGLDIAMPDSSSYLSGYGRGYEQAEKDSHFAEQWMVLHGDTANEDECNKYKETK